MKNKESLFSIDFIMASAASFLLRFSMQFKVTLIPIYILALGLTKVQAGLAMTVFTVFALIFRPPSSIMIEKFGRKTMLIAGIIIFSVSTIPIGLFRHIYFLYVMQAISGIGFSIQSIALTTMVTDIVPEKKLTEGLGYFGLTATLALALGPSLAAWSAGSSNYSKSFIFAGVVMAISILVTIFISYEANNTDKPDEEIIINSFIDRIVERKALLPSILMGSLALASSAILNFLVPYSQEKSISGISMYFTARAVGLVFSRTFAGKLEKVLGVRNVLGLSITGILVGIGGIGLFNSIIPFIFLALTFGTGYGLAHVLLNVTAVRNSPRNRRAYANATYYLAMDLGIGIGSAVWGLVGDYSGMKNIFLAAAAFTFAVLIWFKFSKVK